MDQKIFSLYALRSARGDVMKNAFFQKNLSDLSGRWQAPAAVLSEEPKDQVETRKPLEGPRVAKTREFEGPKGPRTSKAQSALASATICFSRFSQKSRFSWHNLSTFMTAKMHENFNRVLYLRYEHCVKK